MRRQIAALAVLLLVASSGPAVSDQIIYGTQRQLLDPGLPIPAGAAGVYDPTWDRVVYWGGVGGRRLIVNQFAFSSASWTRHQTAAAPPFTTIGSSAVYRSLTHTMVVIGGRQSDENAGPSATNKVYSLDLTGPTPVWLFGVPNGTKPIPRWGHSAVYDATNDVIYVIGGISETGVVLNDVWKLSFTPTFQWTQVAPLGPVFPARWGAGAIFDPVAQRIIIHGGATTADVQSGLLSDLWALNLAASPTWVALTAAGTPPAARALAQCAYDAVGNRMLMVGGTQTGSASARLDTWQLSLGASPAWTDRTASVGTAPNGGYDGIAFVDAGRARFTVVGGAAYRLIGSGGIPRPGFTGYLPLAAGATWDTIPGAIPFPNEMSHPAMLRDPTNGTCIVISTYRCLSLAQNPPASDVGRARNVWRLNPVTSSWTVLPGLPFLPAFEQPLAMLDGPVHRAIVASGNGAYQLDLGSGTAWTPLPLDGTSEPSPAGGFDMASAYDAEQRFMWVYQNTDGIGTPVGTLWRMDVANTSAHWHTLPNNGPPAPRLEHVAAAYDPYQQWVAVYGTSLTTGNAELWAYDLLNGTWLLLPGGEPPSEPQSWSSLTFVPSVPGFVLSGRPGAPSFYQLDGRWTALDDPGWNASEERWGPGAFWDATGNRMVFFGGGRPWGHYTGGVGDLWSLTLQTCDTPNYACLSLDHAVDVGDNDTLSFCPEAPFPSSIQWYHGTSPGIPVTPDAHYSGTNTSHLAITDVGLQHAGTYYAVLTNACGSTQTGNIVLSVFEPFAFGAPIPQESPGTPSEPDAADMNGDNHLDAVFATDDGAIRVALGDGTGQLASPLVVTGDPLLTPHRPVAGDFDEDGRADLLVPEQGRDAFVYMDGDGALNFTMERFPSVREPLMLAFGHTSVAPVPLGPAARSAPVHRVAAPQRRMVAVAGANKGLSITVADLVANQLVFGDIVTDLLPGGHARDLRLVDLGNDHYDDVIALTESNGLTQVQIWMDEGFEAWSAPQVIDVHPEARVLAVGDMDHDGILDLLVGVSTEALMQWMRGLGGGSFAAPVDVSTGWLIPTRLVVEDFNADGRLEAVIGNDSESHVGALEYGTVGGWGTPRFFPAGDSPIGLATGDFVEDGRPDLLQTADGRLYVIPTVDGRGPLDVPIAGKLSGGSWRAAPNPFRSGTSLWFRIESETGARAEILDVTGRRLRQWTLDRLAPGEHRLDWDGLDDAGRAAPAGVYFARLAIGPRVRTTRMVRMR